MGWLSYRVRLGRFCDVAAVIFPRIKRALAWLLGGLGLLWLALTTGRRLERAEGRADRAEDNTKAAQQSKDQRYELESQDDQRIIDILTGKLRDDKR